MGKMMIKGVMYGGGDCANQNLAPEFSESSTYAVDDYVVYQDDLYKCTTAVSTAGSWDNTKWTRAQITDEMGGGSVSSLEDLTDVDITNPAANDTIKWNPTTLKWENGAGGGSGDVADVYVNGASVLDANKIAQITNYVELTQAQYDALPATKLTDNVLYCIKDQATADTTVAPIIYSTDEREVGVWYDGRPLYQKSVNIGKITQTGERTYTIGIQNVDTIVAYSVLPLERQGDTGLYAIDNYNYSWGSGSYTAYTFKKDATAGLQIIIYSGYYTSKNDIYATIQYTKTTDTPGSGKWAPSGVPAEHYSENEQIVGTWIDGSPIYERTFDLESNIHFNSGWQYIMPHNDYYALLFEGKLINTSGLAYAIDVACNDTTYLEGYFTHSTEGRYLVIRYTKTSS